MAPISTIELGVDLATIRAEERSILRSDVLFAGRLLTNKNVDLLLQAVALMKQIVQRYAVASSARVPSGRGWSLSASSLAWNGMSHFMTSSPVLRYTE